MHSARTLRVVMTIIVGLLGGLVAVHSQTAASKPCAGPEYRQFDFWIGAFDGIYSKTR